tara:strand:- start:849 stop:1862 length:1014 start_codon:yes stop_codon:yes gene_type:complete
MQNRHTQLQLKVGNLLNWFLQPKSACIDSEPDFVKKMLIESISSSYDCIDSSLIDSKEFKYTIPKINREKYSGKFLENVLKITDFFNENLDDEITDFILHGSLATLDFKKGWSDFDSIAIIKNSSLNSVSKMLKIRDTFFEIDRMLRQIDAHQHHGVHFITEKDLLMYPDLYMPHKLLSRSVSLSNGSFISLHSRQSRQEQILRFISIYNTFESAAREGVLYHHAYDGEYLLQKFKNHKNAMYQLKYFLSVIVILPSYFSNILGHVFSKSESIEFCRQHVSKANFKIIDSASYARSTWTTWPVKNNIIPETIISTIGENYLIDGYNLIREMRHCLKI